MTDEFFSMRLLNGERLLWTGRPKQGVLFTGTDVFLIPFSLIWSGMVVSFLFLPGPGGPDGMTTVVLTAFVCLGFYMLVGRFIVDAWVRREVRYAVTDRRVLIARPEPFSKFTALKIEQLPEVDLNERANGQGTIRFGAPASMWRTDGDGQVGHPSLIQFRSFSRLPTLAKSLISSNEQRPTSERNRNRLGAIPRLRLKSNEDTREYSMLE